MAGVVSAEGIDFGVVTTLSSTDDAFRCLHRPTPYILKAAAEVLNNFTRRHIGVQTRDHDFGQPQTTAKLNSLPHHLCRISLFTKPRCHRIADMATALAKIVIENMTHAQTADDFPTNKSVKHRVLHAARCHVYTLRLIAQDLHHLGVSHALFPGKAVPVRALAYPLFHARHKGGFIFVREFPENEVHYPPIDCCCKALKKVSYRSLFLAALREQRFTFGHVLEVINLNLNHAAGTHHQRQSGSHTTDNPNELAPFHSITSSARASNVGGIVRPSKFAIMRLMTSSTLSDCCTGRSAAFSPFSIRAT